MIDAVSSSTERVDFVFVVLTAICVALLLLITTLMVSFVVVFRRARHPHPANIDGNTLLEVVWTVLPTVLVLGMFSYGWTGFKMIREVPKDAMVIQVTAKMWEWEFQYPNGKRASVLRVPVNRPVKLLLGSLDVLHSFYIPAFRIKEDAVPGMKTYLWFQARQTGRFEVLCAEFCGLKHSEMMTSVVVMEKADFEKWEGTKDPDPAEPEPPAMALMKERGCFGCHSLEWPTALAPAMRGAFGRKVRVLRGGREAQVVVDDGYMRRALLEPGADVAAGYGNDMPSMKGMFTEKEIRAILDFLEKEY